MKHGQLMRSYSLPKRQRGVAVIFAAVSLVALIAALALGVDTGRLYTAQRDLQRLADLAAIDAVRVASGCFAGLASRDDAPSEARASLERNGADADISAETRLGRKRSSDAGLVFEPVAANAGWDSVQVRLTRPSPARILPYFSGDDTRTLRAQAAAFSGVSVSHGPVSTLPQATDGGTLGAALAPGLGSAGAALAIDPSGLQGSGDNRIRVGDLIDGDSEDGGDGSEIDREQTVRGLLFRLVELLKQSGDTATAAAVEALALSTDASRTLVPSQLLGIPTGTPRALYEDAVINVAALLTAITTSVNNGLTVVQNLDLPPAVCGLTADLGVGLCDTETSSTVTQPGTGGITTPAIDTRTSIGDDFAFSVGGVAEFNLNLVEPITGARFSLPINIRREPVRVSVAEMRCARRGQPQSQVNLDARGGAVEVSIAGARSGIEVPLTGLLPALPGVENTTVRISIPALQTRYGGAATELCFAGPPFPVRRQCDGSLPYVGGTSAGDMANAIAGLAPQVAITVDGLPQGLDSALVNAALAPILANLNRIVPAAVTGFAAQATPLLINTNLPVDGTLWQLESFIAKSPIVYAR